MEPLSLLVDLDSIVECDFEVIHELTQLQLSKIIEKYSNVIANLEERCPTSYNYIRYKPASKAIREDTYHYLKEYFPENTKTKKDAELFVSTTKAWRVVKAVRAGYHTLIATYVEQAKTVYEEQRVTKAKEQHEASMVLKKSKVNCTVCGKEISYNNMKRHELQHRAEME